jgi:hypothetical protein
VLIASEEAEPYMSPTGSSNVPEAKARTRIDPDRAGRCKTVTT